MTLQGMSCPTSCSRSCSPTPFSSLVSRPSRRSTPSSEQKPRSTPLTSFRSQLSRRSRLRSSHSEPQHPCQLAPDQAGPVLVRPHSAHRREQAWSFAHLLHQAVSLFVEWGGQQLNGSNRSQVTHTESVGDSDVKDQPEPVHPFARSGSLASMVSVAPRHLIRELTSITEQGEGDCH